jgi:hypothetical protein
LAGWYEYVGGSIPGVFWDTSMNDACATVLAYAASSLL